MGADGRLEHAGDPAPDPAGDDGGHDGEEDVQRPREPLEVGPDVERRDEPDPVLALAADVEEPAAEGEGDREAREDERRHEDERLLEVVRGVRSRPRR